MNMKKMKAMTLFLIKLFLLKLLLLPLPVLVLLLHGLVELLEALEVSPLLLRPQLVGDGLDLALGNLLN